MSSNASDRQGLPPEWQAFISHHRRNLQTRWEVEFAERVLPRVPQLRPDDVVPQYRVRTSDGQYYIIDFVINHAHGQIAIEIDGFDKTGTGNGSNYWRLSKWAERERNIVNEDFQMLRFTNSEVRYQPEKCAASIIQRLRRNEDATASIATTGMGPASFTSRLTRTRLSLLGAGAAILAVGGLAVTRLDTGDSASPDSVDAALAATTGTTETVAPSTPTPVPDSMNVENFTDTVRPGDLVRLSMITTSHEECEIEYVTPAGTSSQARGIEPKAADARGRVQWEWMIGSGTTPGVGRIEVHCGESSETLTIDIAP